MIVKLDFEMHALILLSGTSSSGKLSLDPPACDQPAS